MARTIKLTGRDLGIDDVSAVARGGARVEIDPEVPGRLAAARLIVEEAVARGEAVYGLTTGLGANLGQAVGSAGLGEFQRRILRGRAVAVGPSLATDIVRAGLVVRANGLAEGGAGASLEALQALVALLNHDIHPQVPSWGSIGAADLAPMAHLALPLIGEGTVELGGAVMAAAEALARCGLAPVALQPKDGLALVSSNALGIGHAALLLADAEEISDLAALAAALAFEGFRANPGPLLAEVAGARPAPGQAAAAARLRQWLAGSALWTEGAPRAIQDPLSFRCVAPVHGTALAALDFARAAVAAELNGAADNPLVLAESRRIVSTGNFHSGGLALAFDTLALALVPVADLAVARAMKLMQPEASGLPKFLTPVGGDRAGFAPVQKTLAALRAECRHRAHPASLDFTPVANGVEDHAPQTPLALHKAGELIELLRRLLAIELAVAAQAIELRKAPLGPPAAAAHRAIRAAIAFLAEDRPLGAELEAAAAAVPAILAAARRSLLKS